jgi:hypothetical protein
MAASETLTGPVKPVVGPAERVPRMGDSAVDVSQWGHRNSGSCSDSPLCRAKSG